VATVPLNSGLSGATQTATLSAEFKTFYDKNMLENMRANLVYQQFGMKKRIPKGGGKTIEFRQWSPLATATTPIPEGTTPDGLQFTVTSQTATVDEYGAYIKGTDVVDVVAYDNLLDGISTELGAQAGETVDEVVREVLVAGTNVIYASTAVSRITVAANMPLSLSELTRAYAQLQTNRARPYSGSNYPLIIHPLQAADLMRDSNIRQAFNAGDHRSELFAGRMGSFMGFDFYVSDKSKVFSGAGASGANVYAAITCGRDAYAVVDLASMGLEFIFKAKGSAGSADPLNQFWTSGWKTVFTAKRLREPFIQRIETGATNG
jgi:N4-gp56 family major capsid protein